MGRQGVRIKARARSVWLLAGIGAGAACGDIDDVQIPLVPTGRATTEVPSLRRVFHPQAVTSVEVVDSAAGSCPIAFSSLLPPGYERAELRAGTGERLIGGDDAAVTCQVERSTESSDVFDVDLLLSHAELPRFGVTGSVGLGRENVVALELGTPGGVSIDADCAAEVIQVQPGAAWLELGSCIAHSGSAASADCRIEVTAIFELCSL
jgi:hypothetical protein